VLANAPAEIQSLVEMVNRTSSLVREREATRVALHNSEERWHLAVSGANDGIWDWEPDSGKVYFSERWKTMLGYSGDEIGSTVEEWISRIHPDDLERTMAEVQKHLRGETAFYECEHRLRCKNGDYKWILDRGSAQFDTDGQPRRMAGSHTDITERRAAEAMIRDRTEQLNSIFALSPDGIVSFDVERRIISVNPAFVRMVAFEEAELIGLTEVAFLARLAKICTPEAGLPDISVLRTLRQDTVLDGRKSRWNEGRYRIELAAPCTCVLEVSLRDGQTGTVSQILYFSDITHKTEVDRLKSEFLSTAAHELRTPMASVLGYSEVMLAQEFDDAERRDFLETILRNARLMSDIINELLDLARIEARRGKDFKIERLPAAGLLREIIADFKVPAGRATPVLELPKADTWLRGDRGKLTQAIGNILSNAYKYSPAGGAVTVDLIAPTQPQESPGDGALPATIGIRIADHGIGMTPLQLARVCERFYRADTSGKISGTGLGMSIVKEIVELHGGNLELDSTSGAGTAVTLWLQVLTQAVTEQPGGTLPTPASTQEMSS
jgi:PAS domain S-box-containing protein